MMRRSPFTLLRCEAGSGAAEFALIALLFIGMLLGIIDMGRLAFELNKQKAATRAGVRYAVTNDMVSDAFASYDALEEGYGAGEKVPSTELGTDTCKSTVCTLGDRNGTAFNNIVAQMQAYDAGIQPANVEVVYQNVGIGVAGNPYAPDIEPLVTVRLTGMTFASGALQIFGVAPFTLPSMASTLSGEDLDS